MHKPGYSIRFSRNNDTLITPTDIARIDTMIATGLATGILTSSTQIEAHEILSSSLIFTYSEISRSAQRLAGLLQGSLSGHPHLYKLVEDREIAIKG